MDNKCIECAKHKEMWGRELSSCLYCGPCELLEFTLIQLSLEMCSLDMQSVFYSVLREILSEGVSDDALNALTDIIAFEAYPEFERIVRSHLGWWPFASKEGSRSLNYKATITMEQICLKYIKDQNIKVESTLHDYRNITDEELQEKLLKHEELIASTDGKTPKSLELLDNSLKIVDDIKSEIGRRSNEL